MTRLVKFCISTPVGFFDRLGAVLDNKFIDLNLAYVSYLANVVKEDIPYAIASARVPTDLLGFIEGGQKTIEAAKEAVGYVESELRKGVSGPKGEKIIYDPKEVKLLPPLPSLKSRMFAMGRNFKGHTPPETWPKRPAGFLKNTYSCVTDGEDIIFPKLITEVLNIEVELVAYIGKKGKNIPKGKAMEYIMGYTVGNDVSARDQQALDGEDKRSVQLGKNADTLAPLGPYLVLKDEVPNPYVLNMWSKVNGKLYQKAVVNEMIFNFEEIIEYYTRDYTLYPGDMIWSGSVAYIDKILGPLKQGDVVECEIEKIGSLQNKVI